MSESTNASNLEEIWGDILSRQPERIRQVYMGLSNDERLAVRAHLEKMLQETGWNDEQRISALKAVEALSGDQS